MEKERKPKQYTHIDYEALLIYAMKRHLSIEDAIIDLDLNIARSTVIRNIAKMKKEEKDVDIINFYQGKYVPNMQKEHLPGNLDQIIENMPSREIVIKPELEDLYIKLEYMKEIIDECNGNLSEATRKINSGKTVLGNVKISRQGLGKNMLHYEEIRKQYEEQMKDRGEDIGR